MDFEHEIKKKDFILDLHNIQMIRKYENDKITFNEYILGKNILVF